MTLALTPERAAERRAEILADVRELRRATRRRLRDLERLEADCARVGIRLVRQQIRPATKGEIDDASRPRPHHR